MITSIILIYFIIMCFYSFVKIKKKVELVVYNNGELLIQIGIILTILIGYFLGLRLLNLFRTNKVLDLTNINFDLNFILTIILIFFFRKLIIYLFKVSWFKFHYVMMCETNFSISINEKYKQIYYNFIYTPAIYSFKYLVYINYIMLFALLFILIYDLIFNNFILNYSIFYFKYYSFFKLIYLSYNFMITKQNLILDYYSYNLIYPGVLETSFFINFSDSSHIELMEESKKYSYGVILEKDKYIYKYLGNTAEMPYFKFLKR